MGKMKDTSKPRAGKVMGTRQNLRCGPLNERTQCPGPNGPQILLGAEGDAGEAGAQCENGVECSGGDCKNLSP